MSTKALGQDGDNHQLVILHIGEEAIGLPIGSIQEIVLVPQLTNVPGTGESVRGIVNLRGQIIPVVALRTLFHMDDAEETNSSRIVVVQQGAETVGLFVDSVSEVVWVESSAIEPLERGSRQDSELITGVAKLDQLVLILDIDMVVGSGTEKAAA